MSFESDHNADLLLKKFHLNWTNESSVVDLLTSFFRRVLDIKNVGAYETLLFVIWDVSTYASFLNWLFLKKIRPRLTVSARVVLP